MEQLLRVSGLVTGEEASENDLDTIERRLAEKQRSRISGSSKIAADVSTSSSSLRHRKESEIERAVLFGKT